jgi:hypothetical protein
MVLVFDHRIGRNGGTSRWVDWFSHPTPLQILPQRPLIRIVLILTQD